MALYDGQVDSLQTELAARWKRLCHGEHAEDLESREGVS